MAIRYLLTTVLGCFLIAPRLESQAHQPVGIERPEVVERWQERLTESELALEGGEWKEAKRSIERVLSEMCDRIEGGAGAARLLGTATLLRSLAEAGLDDKAAANWDFNAAQVLVPEFSKVDLSRFGAAGSLLEPWRFPTKSSAEDETEGGSEEEASDDAGLKEKLIPPKKIRTPRPKYPFGKYQACVDGPIIVQVIIDEEGMPTQPRLLTTQDPTLGFAAMEALRNWRFKPARLGGEPVSVYYNLTVNFKLPICTNPFARAKRARDKE